MVEAERSGCLMTLWGRNEAGVFTNWYCGEPVNNEYPNLQLCVEHVKQHPALASPSYDPQRGADIDPKAAVEALILYAGDDPTRPALWDTPARVLRFFDEVRQQRASEVSPTTFETRTDDLVVLAGIPFGSLCEHHMLPYWGHAHVAYVPARRLLGLSKCARAVRVQAAGLTVQEHLSRSIAEQVQTWAGTKDVGVITTAVHSCLTLRGVMATGAYATAAAMLGAFRDDHALRAEFREIVQMGRTNGS